MKKKETASITSTGLNKALKTIKPIIDVSLIPEKYRYIQDPKKALVYWIKELCFQHLRDDEIILLVGNTLKTIKEDDLSLILDEVREQIELKRSQKKLKILESDKEKLEEYLEEGLKLALKKQDPKAYFAGVQILGNLYGVATLRVTTTQKEEGLTSSTLNVMNKEPDLFAATKPKEE